MFIPCHFPGIVVSQPVESRETYAVQSDAWSANALPLTEGASPRNTILANILQLENAEFPMFVTLPGITTLVRLVQPETQKS